MKKGTNKGKRTHMHLWNVVQTNPHLLRDGNDIHQNAKSLKEALKHKADLIFGNQETAVLVTMETDKFKSRDWEILVVFPVGAAEKDMRQLASFLTTELDTMGVSRMNKGRFETFHQCEQWKKMEKKIRSQSSSQARHAAENLFKK